MTKTKIEKIIDEWEETNSVKFKPTREFYDKKVKIRQKRFHQIVREEKPMTTDEAKNIATFFNVPYSKLVL